MSTVTLQRETFTFSRESEYFDERELRTQTGLSPNDWPLVIVKELIDNALDACETAGIAPVLSYHLEGSDDGLVVVISDNGPGIPPDVITRTLDFTTRTSDKQAYRSPSRGQQGNALKTILTIPYVLWGKSRVVFESRNTRYDVRIALDKIAGHSVKETEQDEIVKNEGCRVAVYTSLIESDREPQFLRLISQYRLFNPHLTFAVGDKPESCYGASDRAWLKWTPSEPTSPWWYTLPDLERLISAHVNKGREGGRDYTLHEFVATFRGLSSNIKRKAIADAMPEIKRLSDFVLDSDLKHGATNQLLALMQAASKPVKADALGVLGEDHFKAILGPNALYYRKKVEGNIPYSVEAATAYDDTLSGPDYAFGINFTPTYYDPFAGSYVSGKYRGDDKYGDGIVGLARALKVEASDNIRIAVHIAHPRLDFTDKAKTRLDSRSHSDVERAVGHVLSEVLKDHCRMKNQKDHAEREYEKQARSQENKVRDVVFHVMAEAVAKASGNGRYPYFVRQLYYAVRPLMQPYTDKELDYGYFTPGLVTEYETVHGSLPGLMYDARGHFYEPHNPELTVPLGTAGVANYQVPEWQYNKILYIEKEGFKDVLDAAQLSPRYDMAIMTGKGFATRAAKLLLARASAKDITILVAHDADSYGFDIARALESETRTSRGFELKIIDIGLSVPDAVAMGLQTESVTEKRKMPSALRRRLSPETVEFLRHRRVELNAMTSDQLVAWIERKLTELGLANKVTPPDEVLSEEIKANVDRNLDEWIEDAIKEAIEKALGHTLAELSSDLEDGLDEVQTQGHWAELATYLAALPTDNWQKWAERKADELGRQVTEQLSQMAEDQIRRVIGR